VEGKAIQDVEFILERIEKRWPVACNRRIEVLEVTSPVAAFYIKGDVKKKYLSRDWRSGEILSHIQPSCWSEDP
jgi:hypothetical protein